MEWKTAQVIASRNLLRIMPPGEFGCAKVEHFDFSEEDSRWSAMRGGLAYCPAGRYAKLSVRGRLMMSNTRMELYSNMQVMTKSFGNVLLAGLGLGMVPLVLLMDRGVSTLTVVEKEPGVIALVGGRLKSVFGNKLEIIEADIFQWRPRRGGVLVDGRPINRFDVVYFDIWSEVCSDNLAAISRLHMAFRPYVNYKAGGWMSSWMHDHLKALRRQGR